ncbi:MAG: glycine zipper domain-containing protein [Longimicrobiales bacterium]
MRRATHLRLLTATFVVLLAACAMGESADNPPGSAVTEQPAASAPAARAAPTSYTLAAGTLIEAAIIETISSRHAHAGDAFSARVAEDVRSAGDWVAIPAGATVHGTITEVSAADNTRSTGTLTLAVSSITVAGSLYDMDASIDALETVNEGRGLETADAARVAGGAAAGAILGRVIGGNAKGTIIGGVVGGAAGAAVSLAMKDMDIVLPAGSRLTLTLRQPLSLLAR